MSNASTVERYAQLLAEDPASPAFVEYARALVEAGELEQAVQVCEAGLQHHPRSVVGRVVWGKALLHLGRPAEAMEQFDAAISGERENAQTYNLISEVLLRKGLYRSAVPLLRKALALSPGDARAQGWLEQAQKALSGGPAPVLTDLLAIELAALDGSAVRTLRGGDVTLDAPGEGGRDGDVTLDAAAPAARLAAPPDDEEGPRTEADAVLPPAEGWEVPPTLPAQPRAEEDPYDRVLQQPSSSEVEAGLSELFTQPEDTVPGAAPPPRREEPSVVVEPAAKKKGRKDRKKVRPTGANPPAEPALDAPEPSATGLLGDVPEAPKSAVFELPSQVRALPAAEPSLKEYERSVREELGRAGRETGLRRHLPQLAAAAAAVLVLGAGVAGWAVTRAAHGGGDVQDALAAARRGLLEDTPASHARALESLQVAARLKPGRAEVHALEALVRALRFGELEAPETEKAQAEAALARAGGKESQPQWGAAVEHLLRLPRPGSPCPSLLAPGMDAPEVRVLAARCLFEQGRVEEGLAQVKAALEDEPRNVRMLVVLGDYQRQAGDAAAAAGAYAAALGLSPGHVGAWLGLAEIRLPRREQLAETLDGLASIPAEGLPAGAGVRLAGAKARVLSALGRHAEARAVLDGAAKAFPHRAFDLGLARGEVALAAGYLDEAQAAFESALQADPRSEAVREALGRLLLLREKPREVLQRITAEPGERRAALVRGLAHAGLGDGKAARAEFTRAAADGRQPVEAVVQWALLDAAAGEAARGEQVLERALDGAGRWRSAVLVGLGRLAVLKKDGERARGRFEEASRDPEDWEGNCQLGQWWLAQGQAERAVEPLRVAVARNPSHLEAREALLEALLAAPRFDEAVAAGAAGAAAAPGSARMHRLHALALVRAARAAEADGPSEQAVRLDASDAVAWRIRAQALAARGQPEEAFKALQRSNGLDPHAPETFCEIGLTFLRRGQGDVAYQAFQAAQRESFGTACAMSGLLLSAPAASNRAMLKDIEQLLARATRAYERGLLKAVHGHLVSASGEVAAARAELDEAALLVPSAGQVHRVRMALAQKGQDAPAYRGALLDAARAEPGWPAVRLQAAELLARGGPEDQKAAAAEYEAYAKLLANRAEAARALKLADGLRKATGAP
jgi:tetratricopeptide (TPR) repeat protein